MIWGVTVVPHWASPQWGLLTAALALSIPRGLCRGIHGSVFPYLPISTLTIKACWAAWPEGRGWSLSSPGSRCHSREGGDDRTGKTGFHPGPSELMRLDHVGPADRGHWKPPRKENQVPFSRNPRRSKMRAAAFSGQPPLCAHAPGVSRVSGGDMLGACAATSAMRGSSTSKPDSAPAPRSASCPFPWAESHVPHKLSVGSGLWKPCPPPLPSQHTHSVSKIH